MGIIALKSKQVNKDYSFQPFVSILVPCYNEEKVISKRIKNLLNLNYPKSKYEILIIDSGSEDRTIETIEKFVRSSDSFQPNLKLIKEDQRRGKASAINLGKDHAVGDVILITDANSIFHEDVLMEIVPHFKDQENGAVSGRYFVSNPNNTFSGSEAFYWEIENITMLGESSIDSISTVIGSISAWRKELMNFRLTAISEDLDMTIQIISNRYKVKYEPQAKVYEFSAITKEDQIRQRKRTSIGTIQAIFKNINYFIFPKNLHSLLIFPSHKILTMISPFLLVAIAILYFIAFDVGVILTHLVLSLIVFSAFLALLLSMRSRLLRDGEMRTNFSIFSMLKVVYYVLLNEYLILIAWKDFISGNHSVLWEKAGSTR